MYARIFGDDSVLNLDYWFDTNNPTTISIAMKYPDAKENNGRYEKGQKVFNYENQKMIKLNADECVKFDQLLSSFITKQTVNYNDPIAERKWSKDNVSTVTKIYVMNHKNLPTIMITTQNPSVDGEEKHYIVIDNKGDLLTIINFLKNTFSILPALSCYHVWLNNFSKKNKKDYSSDKSDTDNFSGPKIEDASPGPSFPTVPDSPAVVETPGGFDGIDMGNDVVIF